METKKEWMVATGNKAIPVRYYTTKRAAKRRADRIKVNYDNWCTIWIVHTEGRK